MVEFGVPNMYTDYETPEEAETAAQKYAEKNGPISFDGMNCNDYKDESELECDGWDGSSRRCECGNRRVYWDIQKNSKGRFSAWATA